MRKILMLTLILASFSSFASESDMGGKTRDHILENKNKIAESTGINIDIFQADELTNCHGQISGNLPGNLIGTCYLSDNGTVYVIAVTERVTKEYAIVYPVYESVKLVSEL